ncbi:MAG: MOSC domain-containing protein [Dehalococcoidia bacterium]|nr:MOSC domain-containing protein [Dehalococcoidia bacterium]
MSASGLGKVVAVCLSPHPGIPKYPQERVTVGPWGIVGDYHARPHTVHPRWDGTRPNRRQVSIVAREVYAELERALGIKVPPGGFAENVLVQGLGDLSHLQPGQRLLFSSGVVLEVTAQNIPCKNLAVYHPQVPKLVYGRRGVVAVVVTTGTISPGDLVRIGP